MTGAITKYVIYHSREWDALVEQGWATHEVIEHPIIPGLRVAVMVPQFQRRW